MLYSLPTILRVNSHLLH